MLRPRSNTVTVRESKLGGSVNSASMSDDVTGSCTRSRLRFYCFLKPFKLIAILFFHPELSPESLWRAGQCFEKSEDFSQARKTYTEVLEEYPESAPAALARERLNELAAA